MPSGGCQGDCMLPKRPPYNSRAVGSLHPGVVCGRHNLTSACLCRFAGAHAEPLHLLLTDVVMPGLVDRLHAACEALWQQERKV